MDAPDSGTPFGQTPFPGFDKFWATWPRNQGRYSRKGGKSECLKVWLKRYHDTQADTILKHVAWLKTTADWLKDGGAFIPAPLVYLNQQRWDGADIPEPEKEIVHASPQVDATRRYLDERASRVPTGPSPEVRAKLAELSRRGNQS